MIDDVPVIDTSVIDVSVMDEPGRGQQWRAYHWLALLPTVGMLGGIPFANRVYPFVLGLPFLFAWLVGWVIATAVIMGLILVLDRAHGVIP